MSITEQELNNEKWFKISNYDSLRPFFMSIVSNSNHWMFISSNGGLTAGRKNNEYALFPYYTDDKLTEFAHTTGSKTIFQVSTTEGNSIWEPFSNRFTNQYKITRNLFKNWLGNKLMFEEKNETLGLTFRYQWNSSNLYGFVRRSSLINNTDKSQQVKVLDGIQNILPYGVDPDLQTKSSNLVDAYKRSELEKETGLGIFALSAIIVDKAEPSEALKANVAWSLGIENPTYLLSSLQLDNFRNQKEIQEEVDVKGEKGAYFVVSNISLSENETKKWTVVANVNHNSSQVIQLNEAIKKNDDLENRLLKDVEEGSKKLKKLVAASDGLQFSSDQLRNARHFSNVLFNIMRGGTFDFNYQIEKNDFAKYIKNASKDVFESNNEIFKALDNEFDKSVLDKILEESSDVDFVRLGKEYLPLKFSRRHGDPSRPWNQFSINTHNEVDGSKILDYEGNWRDIFQNWEALAHSYPDFIEGMIYKFLNASTFDGYNPYRVTKDGFDWEESDPDDPWSYIGYWGDHQIIYLLKFLEFYEDHYPDAMEGLFDKDVFVYANVPYKIKSYEEIAKDPKDTIEFDVKADKNIWQKVDEKGADGALRINQLGEIHHVNFVEKILATVLAKVSNFIPEGGIWMNTQRPEWNDANNALVGNGVSMVTLCYLRRFLKFFEPVIKQSEVEQVQVSKEIKDLFENISVVLNRHTEDLRSSFDNSTRKAITEGLGKAGSDFRDQIYEQGFTGSKEILDLSEISDFIDITLEYLEQSIRSNKREDNLYHAYNIMSFKNDGISISYLDEMLEGQVAALSSGYLEAEESVQLLDALRESALYREDQMSYILYPNKKLPGFLERNNLPKEAVEQSELLQELIKDGNNQIVNKDVNGGYHYNGNFKNARDLKQALDDLRSTKYASLVEKEEKLLLEQFEDVFNHKAFTGRSGTFYGYEGLGSIYWHMVSKLHLAVYEICETAHKKGVDKDTLKKLSHHFDEIGEGIGVHKTPELYGAFPTDPYSHTPQHRGAQQPGMTGQVKEDILVRIGQLGVIVENGELHFNPFLLKKDEFTSTEKTVELVDLDHDMFNMKLPAHSVAFTCCQIPVVYQISNEHKVEVLFEDDSQKTFESKGLDKELTQKIFHRTGEISQITVALNENQLR
ncbi:MAG: hypothetical protein RI564_01140 [Gracilimonas sp.]|nr:hypothetical protein [Gracilimonas sp.]